MLLKGKNSVVTGANRGIGLEIVKCLSAQGANVWACCRDIDNAETQETMKSLSEKNSNWIELVAVDFSDEETVAKASRVITKKKVPIDIIVNNAGVIDTSIFAMTSIKSMKSMFDVNYFSQMSFTQRLIRPMIKQKSGSIINIASSAAIEANEGRASYAASKSALITTGKVMSRELGVHNIRVNSVAPGLTETDMMKSSTPPEILDATLERVSLRRVAAPAEIANSVLFLASDLSSYMTGQVLSVDGGM
ncbi:3-oxoacyl-ACP reductase [Gammaproteobacteria bacterium 45_16_T64]|nr:3-oxoacyl-ACP reductase [Gammaproteobacteria bacterium 45_16_T64]